MKTICAVAVVALGSIAATVTEPPRAVVTTLLADAAEVVRTARDRIPADEWERAECVVVAPRAKSAAMSCRAGERWSAPVFFTVSIGSARLSADADVLLLVASGEAIQRLTQDQATLGPSQDVIAYSSTRGVVQRTNLSGAMMKPDATLNQDVYGDRATPRTILAVTEISAPTDALPLLAALGSRSTATPSDADRPAPRPARGATPAVESSSATVVAAPEPTTPPPAAGRTSDADVRARVVQIGQSLDRLIANSSSNATGTAGTTGTTSDEAAPGTVVVNRAELVALRQQIAALLASIDRRP